MYPQRTHILRLLGPKTLLYKAFGAILMLKERGGRGGWASVKAGWVTGERIKRGGGKQRIPVVGRGRGEYFAIPWCVALAWPRLVRLAGWFASLWSSD